MKFLNLRLSLLALGTVAALVSTSAHAVWVIGSTDWTAASGTTKEISATAPSLSGDPNVKLSGFSVTNSTSTGPVTTGTWTSRGMQSWAGSGMGVLTGNETAPQHAVDNVGSTEAVLLDFGGKNVNLTSIGLGWMNGAASADVSLFRWVGVAGQSQPNLVGQTGSSLTSSGWELVGNYDMGLDTSAPAYSAVNASGVSSSWWLIAAYNSGLTTGMSSQAVSSKTFGVVDNAADYFKLYAVAGNVVSSSTGGKLPEPASLALAGVGLLGVAGLRRRHKVKLTT